MVFVLIIRLVKLKYLTVKQACKTKIRRTCRMGDEDPYALLQIKITADVNEIRRSYQRLARQVCVTI